jgi:hypothetical protein
MTEIPDFEAQRGGVDIEHATGLEGVTEDTEPRGDDESVETPPDSDAIE